jgi:hypothetical protein
VPIDINEVYSSIHLTSNFCYPKLRGNSTKDYQKIAVYLLYDLYTVWTIAERNVPSSASSSERVILVVFMCIWFWMVEEPHTISLADIYTDWSVLTL